MIAAVGAALDAAVRRINFEAAVAAAKYCLGKYLGGYGVSERRSSEWLLHHSLWSRGEGKSMYPTRADISLSRALGLRNFERHS